jgi:hypothetical protein
MLVLLAIVFKIALLLYSVLVGRAATCYSSFFGQMLPLFTSKDLYPSKLVICVAHVCFYKSFLSSFKIGIKNITTQFTADCPTRLNIIYFTNTVTKPHRVC